MKKMLCTVIALSLLFAVTGVFSAPASAAETFDGWTVTSGDWRTAEDGTLEVVTGTAGDAVNYDICLTEIEEMTGDFEVSFETYAFTGTDFSIASVCCASRNIWTGFMLQLNAYGAVYYDIDPDITDAKQVAGSDPTLGVKYAASTGEPVFNKVTVSRISGKISVVINGELNLDGFAPQNAVSDGRFMLGLQSDGSVPCAFRNIVVKANGVEKSYFTVNTAETSSVPAPDVSSAAGSSGTVSEAQSQAVSTSGCGNRA